MATQAVIFDFDGVISLSEHVHLQAWRDIGAGRGWEVPESFLESGIGATDRDCSEALSQLWEGKLDSATILSEKRIHYRRRSLIETHLTAGLLVALERFSKTWPLGIATSSGLDDITPLLARHDIRSFFKVIRTVESVTFPKPHPEIYLGVAADLGVAPENCWVFEDSPIGIRAASAAGMRVIGVTSTYQRSQMPPVRFVTENFLDLERLLGILSGG